jgi:spermidine synthase
MSSPPWVLCDTSAIPGSPARLNLLKQGDAYSIQVGSAELMTNLDRRSEQALATIACERLEGRPAPRILIGGLGMGFTLRAALGALGPDAKVVVAELIPAVVAWARGPLAHLFGDSLDDPRVEIAETDVNRLIQSGPEQFDAILLDVDNGPSGMTRRENDRLYDAWGLKRAHYALRSGGILAVWSGKPDRRFKARLRLYGFAVEEFRIHANGGSDGPRHVLWMATRPARPLRFASLERKA